MHTAIGGQTCNGGPQISNWEAGHLAPPLATAVYTGTR